MSHEQIGGGRGSSTRGAVTRGLGYLAFWVVLIGIDPVDLAVGLGAAALATWASLRLLPPGVPGLRATAALTPLRPKR